MGDKVRLIVADSIRDIHPDVLGIVDEESGTLVAISV